ncbi:MAG TPA: cation diffusion facilitator family transporter, partial [Dehalococcoidales bacterium]|nr:cation diffusion facilitator family transporter [Dehalococcoidales bacterium]
DAGHVFADIIALSLSWYGVKQVERPASSRMTFGYHRVGVLIALVNALSIFAIAGVIFYEAYRRWLQPPEVNSLLMLSAALVGLGVNVFVAFWLRNEQRTNLNVRSAFWHVLGDALASIGVIIGAIIIMLTGWYIVDPIISVFIGLIITFAAWSILKEGLKVLLEAVPHRIDVNKMVRDLQKIPGVNGVHDIHVWSISPELHAMSCHVLIDDMRMSRAAEIRQKVEKVLQHQFDIHHSALQMECQECGRNDLFCSLTPISQNEDHEKSHD